MRSGWRGPGEPAAAPTLEGNSRSSRHEQYAEQGQIAAWSHGDNTILAFFHQPRGQDGRMIRRILRDSAGTWDVARGFDVVFGTSLENQGRVESAASTPPQEPSLDANQVPFSVRDYFGYGDGGAGSARVPTSDAGETGDRSFPTVEAALAAFENDPGLARRLPAPGRKGEVTGTYGSLLVTVAHLSSKSGKGRLEARLHGGAAARIGQQKQPGEPIAVRGRLAGFEPRGRVLMLTDCDFQ